MNASVISSALARPYYTATLACMRFSNSGNSAVAFKLAKTSMVKKGKKTKLITHQGETAVRYSASTYDLRSLELIALYYALESVENGAVLNAIMHKDLVRDLQNYLAREEQPADPTEQLLLSKIANTISSKHIKFAPLHIKQHNVQQAHEILINITEHADQQRDENFAL